MNEQRKRLPWRCKNQQQAKDKATIYNSREWKELRRAKLRAQPLCEKCLADGKAAGVAGGWIRSAHCVHHITPIETAATMEEMRRLAFNPANLMSLCDECHHKIHEEMRSFDPSNVNARAEARQARWAHNIVNRFLLPAHSESEYEEIKEDNESMNKNKRLGIFGTLNYEKLKDMSMDERKSAVTNHVKDVLSRETMDGKGPQLPADDYDPYDLSAEYTIMDCRYNKQGKIIATLKAQRTIEGVNVELVSFEAVTI